MRVFCLISLLSVIGLSSAFSQVVQDSFSDEEFTSNPAWSGIPADFIVNSDTVLQLENTSPSGSDVSFLTTVFASTSLDNKEWQFWIKQSFSGSANNFGQFWLASDAVNPTTASAEGYFLQFGEAGSDDAIELFYSNSGLTTSVCRGADALIAGSFEMRVRVRRDAVGLWTVEIDEAGGYDFVPHTSGTNTTATTTDHLGVLCKYTSSNADNFFYDDIYFGDYILDITAPEVTAVTLVSSTEVDVQFSEAVTQTTAETASNYVADGALGSPNTAVLDGSDPSLVHLTYSAGFTNGTTYNLTIANVEDPAGNVLVTTTEPFTYVLMVPAGYRDVVINEFMCDPSPVVGLPEAEFVELYNTSSNYIDIGGWKLGDATAFGTIGAYVMAPGEYALLISSTDAPLFSVYTNVVEVSSFPSLNNSGDDIVLQDTGEVTIDQLSYDLTWYQDEDKESGGYSLEQINPFASCANPSNWSGSSNSLGGTPSAVNAVFDDTPDTEGPSLVGLTILGAQSLELQMSEALDAGAISAANIVIDPSLGIATASAIAPANQNIMVTLTAPIDTGVVYTLYVTGIADCEGNLQEADSTTTFTIIATAPAGFRDVVINEFMCNPSPAVGLAEAEFVELYNTSSNNIDLEGWKLGDASSFGTVGAHIIGPGEYALLTSSANALLFAFYANVVEVSSFPSLNNSGDDIVLQDTNEVTIDQLRYDDTWYQDEDKEEGGYSLEQINPFAACTNASNWRGSSHPLGGTPSAINAVFDDTPDAQGPALVGLTILGAQSLELQMSEALDAGTISTANIVIDPSLGIVTASAIAPTNQNIVVTLIAGMDTGVVYTLYVTGIADCEGNLQATDSVQTFILPFEADSGNFVINEVLFNPFTGGSDYVELVNISDRPLNLKGWMLASYDAEEGVSDHKLIIGQNYTVEAGGYVLITEDTTDVRMNYIQHGTDNFIEADMPSYSNDSGTVYLLNIDSVVTESFSYNEDMHFPLLSVVDGVSLERLDVNRPVNDKGNWHSAAQTVGFGTPGVVNSQYYPTSEAQGEVSMDPEIFSPDNDAYNDVLNINYSFTEPGFVGTIRIYDANGRPVRELASNVLLETAGTFTWDGTSDSGEKARIGMYIILFEAFSDDGKSETYKMSTVLGGRL